MTRLVRAALIGAVLVGAGACAVMCPRKRQQPGVPVTAPVAPASAPATQSAGAPLSVTIKDLRNRKGVLIFGVFRTADGFPTEESKAVFWEVRDAAGDDLTFTTRLPPGRYGASVLHDENRSGNMDRGVAGIPLEGYGVTNNPKPRFRAATFKEATFELPEQGAAMSISVQYF
jgi:uncharacterized protein (DUF2141 family)